MNSVRISLVVVDGPNEGDEIPVRCTPFLIGRLPGCPVRLGWQWRPSGAGVADRHCELVVHGRSIYLKNCDGTDGTFINGRRMTGAVELHDGDQLMIGEWQLQVRIDSGPASSDKAAVTTSAAPAEPSPASPPAVNRADKASRSAGNKMILVGPKDRAMPLLRQREWERTAQDRTPPSTLPPKKRTRWLLAVGGVGLVAALLVASYLAGAAASPRANSPASASEPPWRPRQPGSPAAADVKENQPLPPLDSPPPRRRPTAPRSNP